MLYRKHVKRFPLFFAKMEAVMGEIRTAFAFKDARLSGMPFKGIERQAIIRPIDKRGE